MPVRMLLIAALAAAVCGCGGPGSSPSATSPEAESIIRVVSPEREGAQAVGWSVKSSAFAAGARMPERYTGEGADVSPPLSWTAPPPGTVSLALVCDDPDAPGGTWTHWLCWNLPPDTVSLPEGVPGAIDPQALRGGVQGTNDFGVLGYKGPMPPPGPEHRYFFRLYALDNKLNLAPRVRRKSLDMAMAGHVLAETAVVGTYAR